jgi:hypothetical protein
MRWISSIGVSAVVFWIISKQLLWCTNHRNGNPGIGENLMDTGQDFRVGNVLAVPGQ